MLDDLRYPFDSELVLRKKRSFKRKLKEMNPDSRMKKKIAILGGSSTQEIRAVLELFLLNSGIEPEFYESEYGKYWEDVMFGNDELVSFSPDLVYVHTSNRNIHHYPDLKSTEEEVVQLLDTTYQHFESMWSKIRDSLNCPIIQNNFDMPFYRLMGNRDVVDFRGRNAFIARLNLMFSQYAANNKDFYINDICWLSASFGLQRWADPFSWHMYKMAPASAAVPELAYNVANIIKSLYGKNKKVLALDLDNTLWGGVVGDSGPEGIDVGQETSLGQIFAEFQDYLRQHKDLGIVLAINSKNEEENALKGLARPGNVLKAEDFAVIKANWEPKDRNIVAIANELNLGTDSVVFVDDNPAERQIVRLSVPEVEAPEMKSPESYISTLDRAGYFETVSFSEDDLKRNKMYEENRNRARQEAKFADYGEYLQSLEMKAEIAAFAPMHYSRITQLTNKTNQFNLTTRRCTPSEIEQAANDPSCITLYGRLEDKFGDNGLVSVVFGHCEEGCLHIDLWLMSCRVLKRNMEQAMLDALVERCKVLGVKRIRGYYYPTAKNGMVADFYGVQGFDLVEQREDGSSEWQLEDLDKYEKKNRVIAVLGAD